MYSQSYYALDNADPRAVRAKSKVDRNALTAAERIAYDLKCSRNRAKSKAYRKQLREKRKEEAVAPAQSFDGEGAGGEVSMLVVNGKEIQRDPQRKYNTPTRLQLAPDSEDNAHNHIMDQDIPSGGVDSSSVSQSSKLVRHVVHEHVRQSVPVRRRDTQASKEVSQDMAVAEGPVAPEAK